MAAPLLPNGPHFVDRLGRLWVIELNVTLARAIKQSLGLDFLNAHDGKAIASISQSDELLVECLWMLCERQAAQLLVRRGDCENAVQTPLEPEEFAAGLGGDELQGGLQAIGDAVILFSRPAKRPVMKALLDRAGEVQEKGGTAAAEKVKGGSVDRLIETELAKMDAEFDRLLTASSSPTSGPESSGSTPDRSA